MNLKYRSVIAVIFTGVWVNASEFLRNEVFLKAYWINHYQSLGMTFPSSPQNGAIWVVWGFLFAIAIYIFSRRFSLLHATLLSWLVGFVLMWLVMWNLNVLPTAILVYAIPLSLLETFMGTYISRKYSPPRGQTIE